jgi:cytochrome c5
MRATTFFIALLLVTPTLGQVQTPPAKPNATSKQSASPPTQPKPSDDGERVFQQNCSRCHNAPSGFSPRISGTIVRHMRVRASLSKRDEEALLHFLNP